MRKLYIAICATLLSFSLAAQLPGAYLQLESELPSGWTTRLEQALLAAEFGIDTIQPITLHAKAYPLQESKTDQTQHLLMVQYELVLELRMSGSGELLSSESFAIDGVGKSNRQAMRACGQAIQYRKTKVKNALDKLHQTYRKRLYENCAAFLQQLEYLRNQNRLAAALALADGIPVDAPCYAQAQQQRSLTYQTYQQNHCNEHLQQAKLYLTKEMPSAALDELAKIDPKATCATEVEGLLTQTSQMLKTQQAAKAQFLRNVYQNQVGIEQARTEIINNIIGQ